MNVDGCKTLLDAADLIGWFRQRTEIVADFNHAGRPDIFGSCRGYDASRPVETNLSAFLWARRLKKIVTRAPA
ncbi:hypothetical protein [Paraburkholderia sp.]|uniref:hypothetical protein n=1 Tax=Paraburkholderia sp. TaxID=1926495 RepID=UPI0039E325D5